MKAAQLLVSEGWTDVTSLAGGARTTVSRSLRVEADGTQLPARSPSAGHSMDYVEMPDDSRLREDDALAIGGDLTQPKLTLDDGGHRPFLHDATLCDVEEAQPNDDRFRIIHSKEPELILAGPTGWGRTWLELRQQHWLSAGKWMKHRPLHGVERCSPSLVWRHLEIATNSRLGKRSGPGPIQVYGIEPVISVGAQPADEEGSVRP